MKQCIPKASTKLCMANRYLLLPFLSSVRILNLISKQYKVIATQRMHKELHIIKNNFIDKLHIIKNMCTGSLKKENGYVIVVSHNQVGKQERDRWNWIK